MRFQGQIKSGSPNSDSPLSLAARLGRRRAANSRTIKFNPGAERSDLGSEPSTGPIRAKQFRLLKDGLRGLLLFVGRIAVFAEDAFYGDADFSSHSFTFSPVNGDAIADGL